MLQSSSRNHKLNSQNGMARTVVTPARWAAKETNELVLIYLAEFLKTSLTKFAVILVLRRQKAGFLTPRSSKILVTKEKETRKIKSEEKRKKPNGCNLRFCNSYFGNSF